MKKEAGISIAEIIISIAILLMIAFLAIFASKNSIPEAKATEVYAEMRAVKEAVSAVQTDMLMNDNFSLQEGVHYDEVDGNNYILYGSLDEENTGEAAKQLGLESLKRSYIVNYETGEIELKEAVEIQGRQIKTMSELNDLLNSGALN